MTTSTASDTAKGVAVVIAIAAIGLMAFGCYMGDPIFFLKWIFGLQADD